MERICSLPYFLQNGGDKTKEEKVILAFDQASSKTGYSLMKNNYLLDYGLINLSKEKDAQVRFKLMCTSIRDKILKYNPDIVAIEDVSLQTNVSTLVLLSRIQGSVFESCFDCNIPCFCYKPTKWRKSLGFTQGRGVKRKELKEQAIEYVKNTYKVDTNIDTCEAVCIGAAAFILL